MIACVLVVIAVVCALIIAHKFTRGMLSNKRFALSSHIGMVSIVVRSADLLSV